MESRNIPFKQIDNARELGGLRTAQGSVIIPGLLLRSANLSDAVESDIRTLEGKYRLALVIDLRTETEREEKPDVSVPHADYLHIPVFDESTAGISHEKGLEKNRSLTTVPKLVPLYRHMVTDMSCRGNLGRAAKTIMEHDFSKGSVLWHCTEGKDRCGLLTAVLLIALGAERSTIMEDYLLTNRVNAAKAEGYYKMLLSAGRTEDEASAVRDVFLSKAEYLNEAFSAIDEQYGSADGFLRCGLGIQPEVICHFQRSVLMQTADC